MTEDNLTDTSKLSPKNYIATYLMHYKGHRPMIVDILLAAWQNNNANKRAIKGSRILLEFGASIEELFAYTYAVHAQCNVEPDEPSEKQEVFFEHLFRYKHSELFHFVKNNDFIKWTEINLRLPESKEMASRMNISVRDYIMCLADIEGLLESKKNDFFGRKFNDIYNKLKHPFLVLPSRILNETEILPVLTKSVKKQEIAKVIPVEISLKAMQAFQSDIFTISKTIEFLLTLLLRKYNVQNSPD